MNVNQALYKRKSVRAFQNKSVEQSTIKEILSEAAQAPSGVNTQPWEIVVMTGQRKDALQQKLEATFRAGQKQKMDYSYYPNEWQAPYKERRKTCGLLMFQTLKITREDKKRQQDQWAANYRSFDAPVMMLFFMDKIMQTGSYMDYGMFLQSIMLSATAKGLATCPQAALGEYPDIIRQDLGFDENKLVICGMALGYEDESALVNSYRTPREDVDSFTQFLE